MSLRFASWDPIQVLRSRAFWLQRERNLLVIGVAYSFFVAALLLSGTLPIGAVLTGEGTTADSWSALLQIAVLVVGLIGFARVSVALARTAIDQDAAWHVVERAEDEIRIINSGNRSKLEIDRVPELWPANDRADLTTLRLCHAIYTDGRDRQFGTREVLVETQKADAAASTDRLHSYQRTALHLGITGTFVGLLSALPNLTALVSSKFEPMVLADLFSALRSCFATSVTGLILSILMGVAVGRLQAQQNRFFGVLEKAALSISILVRHAINRQPSIMTLDEIGESLGRLGKTLKVQNDRIAVQTQSIEAGMAQLKIGRTDLDSFLNGVQELRENLQQEIRSMLESLAPENYQQAIEQHVEHVADRIGTALATRVSTALDDLRSSSETLREVQGSVSDARLALRRSSEALHTQSESASTHTRDIRADLEGLKSDLAAAFREEIQPVAESCRSESDKVRTAMTDLEAARSVFRKEQAAAVESLCKNVRLISDDHARTLEAQVQQQESFLKDLRESQLADRITQAIQESNDATRLTLQQGFADFNSRVDKIADVAFQKRIRSWVAGFRSRFRRAAR